MHALGLGLAYADGCHNEIAVGHADRKSYEHAHADSDCDAIANCYRDVLSWVHLLAVADRNWDANTNTLANTDIHGYADAIRDEDMPTVKLVADAVDYSRRITNGDKLSHGVLQHDAIADANSHTVLQPDAIGDPDKLYNQLAVIWVHAVAIPNVY